MRRPLALLAILPALGCGGKRLDVAALASSSDQILWDVGHKAFEKKDWETARQYFRRIVEGFPQSEHQPGARLGLADSHYLEGGTANYILAISEYRDFLTLYPSHPKADYAQFQVAECYFRQRNSPDRDQTPTKQALAEYQRLLDIYPSSTYVEQTRERVHACRQSLARAEFLVGYFYQRTRDACRSAILRYQVVLSDYPDYDELDEVLYRIAQCLAATGRVAEALPHLGRLLSEYPRSSFAEEAQRLMGSLRTGPTPPSPAPAPSPAPPPPPAR